MGGLAAGRGCVAPIGLVTRLRFANRCAMRLYDMADCSAYAPVVWRKRTHFP